ncbi:MAG: aldo/keto reductase [Asticcacaulis sp.]
MTVFNVTANGAVMPAIGFGTFRMPESEVLKVVPEAIKTGFRHIDTAQFYDNESAVGQAIIESGVAREDIFLTTKIRPDRLAPEVFVSSLHQSLKDLKTDYVDLLLLHWPVFRDAPLEAQIATLNEVRSAGLVRHIGVSNYTVDLMRQAVALSEAPIVTNQIEFHPYLRQDLVYAEARKLGLSVTGYFAMANGQVHEDEVLKTIAARTGKTVAQVVLRWAIQHEGVAVLSKTATVARVRENFDIFDFELTPEDMTAISGLTRSGSRMAKPEAYAPVWDND